MGRQSMTSGTSPEEFSHRELLDWLLGDAVAPLAELQAVAAALSGNGPPAPMACGARVEQAAARLTEIVADVRDLLTAEGAPLLHVVAPVLSPAN